MDRHLIQMPEGNIHVVTDGDGGPPVLLLSGGGIDNALLSWKHMIPALAPTHRVIAPDWPKQGLSRPWSGVADHQRLLRCITEVLDHFSIERASVVGLSQGGALALAYAIAEPKRVERVVAIAPGGTLSFPPGLHQLLWLSAKLPWLLTATTRLFLRHRSQCALFARKALFTGPVEDFDDVVDAIHDEVLAGGGGASDWQNNSIGFLGMKVDLRPDLHRIDCPVLFVQGDKDIGVAPRHTIDAARRVAGSELTMLKNNGHWPNRQSPGQVNELVAAFLARPLQEARRRR